MVNFEEEDTNEYRWWDNISKGQQVSGYTQWEQISETEYNWEDSEPQLDPLPTTRRTAEGKEIRLRTHNHVFRGWSYGCQYCGEEDHHSCVIDQEGNSVARYMTAEDFLERNPRYPY